MQKSQNKRIWGDYINLFYTVCPSVLLLARYDSYDPDIGVLNNEKTRWTFGVNYFIDKNVLVMNNYERRLETPGVKNDIFMVQLQVKF